MFAAVNCQVSHTQIRLCVVLGRRTAMKGDKTMTTSKINVMAPLVVGDPADPHGKESLDAWKQFKAHLAKVKAMGVYGVSTDVWWGLVEKQAGKYDWNYYDKLSNAIIEAGLKWIPIISLHRCGGNVGDDVTVDVPAHIWPKLAGKLTDGQVHDVQYVSEQGNASNEFVSAWATYLVLDDYRAVFNAFQKQYGTKAKHIAEINISLGPAGELRYPSYNGHDDDTGYPFRGALQCYSRLARESFTRFVLGKYTNEDGVRKAWGSLDKIEPPVDVTAFFAAKLHLISQYGRDLFDWYQESLLAHGRKVLTAALEVFAADDSALKGADIGAKVPGVHWRTGNWKGDKTESGDRLAELTCGLIRTSAGDWNDDEAGRGYRHIIKLFSELQAVTSNARVVLHFTCLEMPDGGGGDSLAFQLVRWVGTECRRQGVIVKGENALAHTLNMRESWHRMRMAIGMPGRAGLYEGLTILRMSDIVTNDAARAEMEQTIALTCMCEGVAGSTAEETDKAGTAAEPQAA